MKKIFYACALIVCVLTGAYALPTDAQLKQQLVEQSIAAYPGRCPCPYHTDRAGRRCGARSAYSRRGGYAPLCYTSDVSDEALQRAREKAARQERLTSENKENTAPAQEPPQEPLARGKTERAGQTQFDDVTLLRVIDGDTFQVSLPCEEAVFCQRISVRVRGIDTPELRSQDPKTKKRAQEARRFTEAFLEGERLQLSQCGRDKYFRLLCDVTVDGKSLADALLAEGLAKEYDGGGK